ncbi:hypothetical protein [Streptomyces sp. SBT349]|uniref:hypothetical protein n=1 Tax=Streptomyces sp. SBT349 TaxID=1580539 RepID=UPI00066CBC0A|nr:hypothetical protein [Streptomyces sp. SBT349]
MIEGLPEEAGWGGVFDIPGAIAGAITGFIGDLVEAAMEPFLGLLGATLLATPEVTGNETLVGMWTGALGVALAGYVLVVMAGGVTLMGYETVQTRYAVKQIAPRLVVGVLAAATSLLVVGKVIDLANALSTAVLDVGDLDATGEGMAEMLLGGMLISAAPVDSLVLVLVLLVMVVAVLIGYLVRVALIALLAVSGPLALCCHGLPQTEGVAKLWWRALGGCMAIQVCQAVALAVGLRLFFAPGNTVLGFPNPGQLETLLAGVCLFWILWKIPGWTVQVILRGSPMTMPHAPAPVRMLRGVAMAMLLHRYLPAARGAAAGGGSAAGRRATTAPVPGGAAASPGAAPVPFPVPGPVPGRRPPGLPLFLSPDGKEPDAPVTRASGPPPSAVFQPPEPHAAQQPKPRKATSAPANPVFRSPAPPPAVSPAPDGQPLAPVPPSPRFEPPVLPAPAPQPRKATKAPPPPVFRPPVPDTALRSPRPRPSVPPPAPVFRAPQRPTPPPAARRKKPGRPQ